MGSLLYSCLCPLVTPDFKKNPQEARHCGIVVWYSNSSNWNSEAGGLLSTGICTGIWGQKDPRVSANNTGHCHSSWLPATREGRATLLGTPHMLVAAELELPPPRLEVALLCSLTEMLTLQTTMPTCQGRGARWCSSCTSDLGEQLLSDGI